MSQYSLGEFELLVLLAAIRLGENEAYAVSIVDEIELRTDRRVQRASVYVTVQRLERKGLVSTALGDPIAERGGKARRLIKVEAAGVKAVQRAHLDLTNMWGGLEVGLKAGSLLGRTR